MVKEALKRQQKYWWRGQSPDSGQCQHSPKPGDICPKCGHGQLAYDPMFLLICASCSSVIEGGAFT